MNVVKKIFSRVYPPAHLAFYLQRGIMDPKRRTLIAGFFARRLPTPDPALNVSGVEELHSHLEADGFVEVPNQISPAQIEAVLQFLRHHKCVDRWHPEHGSFLLEDVPPNTHVADYAQDVIMACPHLIEIANSPQVLGTVQRSLGCKPTISGINLWWSFPGHTKAEDAELYHRDVDEWHFIKLFIYLTDVTGDSGPHKFIRGSHRLAKLLPIRRYTDAEVHSEFGAENEITFTGAKGTSFLEKTFGFHKGQMPVSDRRLVFQAQYSLFPIGINKYVPSPAMEKNADLDRYINRLYSARASQ